MQRVCPGCLAGCWFIAAMLWCGSGVAEVYRWTDAAGQVHYGDRPPDTAERIELPPMPAHSTDPTMQGSRARQQRLLEVFEHAREQKKSAATRTARQRQEDARRCEDLRQHWGWLAHGGPIYYYDEPDGARDYLDERRRNEEKDRLRPIYRQFCGVDP